MYLGNKYKALASVLMMGQFFAVGEAMAEDEDTSFAFEEIVVTAQKRAENLQDIPLAVSAYGKRRLEDAGFDNLADLSFMTPSLQFGNFGPVAFVAIRGAGLENTTAGGDPGVALHIDGVYLGRPVATMFNAFDLERVEVLRGPQGTLYGRNATGGSVNFITAKPTDEIEGLLDVTGGNYDWFRLRGMLNLPLNDKMALRVTGFRETRDGYTENTYEGGTKANDADNYGFRGHLNVEVSDNVNMLLSASYVKVQGVGSQPEVREPFPSTNAGPPFGAAGPGPMGVNVRGPGDWFIDSAGNALVNDLTAFKESKNTRESVDNDMLLLSATLTWDLEDITIKSISAYAETSFESHQDSDSSSANLAELVLTENANQFSQELQFLSNNDSPLQWIFGLFYFEEDATRASQFFEDRFDFFAKFVAQDCCGVDLGGSVNAKSYAAFGQASYQVSDDVRLTFGGRWTKDEKDGINSNVLFAPRVNDKVGIDDSQFTWRAVVDWKVNEDVMLYASASTGYKSGGINQVAITSAGREATYDPEFVDAYEVGVKSTLFDGRLRLNLSVFLNQYDDLQFQIFEFGGPAAFNAKGAEVKGIDGDFQLSVTDTIGFDGSFGYMDSEYDEQILSGVQLGGNQLSRTPEWTFNIGANKDWVMTNYGALRLRVEYSYTDDIFYTPFNRDDTFSLGGSDRADSYNNVNIRLFYTSEDDLWTVEGSVTNVFDEVQTGNILRGVGFLDEAGGGGQEFITYNPPRQWGLRVSRRF
ncbi:MAG: TonB-dependent receptor [Alphaproteobacteria bacterium]|nr:MAG: TonB-dependent receptor [Alphaproteobacteria bacterium]